jgi:hypothetical protein
LSLFACQQNIPSPIESPGKLFQKVLSEHTGIQFLNELNEDKENNALSFESFSSGSGVAIIDVNNDGLQDIYFGASRVADKLYLNHGHFKFEDISLKAGIGNENTWTNGIAIGDVNGDGYDDIYVCKGLYDFAESRKNLLYINQQNGQFKELGAVYGVDDQGYGIMANFFDFDHDGDLDLYVANQPPNSVYQKQQMKGKKDYQYTDRLFRNDGARFTDVTRQAGITNFNYSLSVTVADLNNDGWSDIYITSDYEEPDFLYINQQNGTFTNQIHEEFRHLSNFSMGADFADINRDGWMDIFVADMVSEDNYLNKTTMSGMNPERFWLLANNGYHFQYMFNTLQLNNGNGSFSDIAHMAGVSATDWSWAPLFLDIDLDGYQDLFVTNGQFKDTRNKDFDKEKNKLIEKLKAEGMDGYQILFEVSKVTPQQKTENYVFRNNGDLTFTKKISEWGFAEGSWSHGAAYADLDNDGDLDMVVNNLEMDAFIFRNTAADQQVGNYINIRLKGPKANSHGLQSKVKVVTESGSHYGEMTNVRGYLSSSEPIVQFGLGDINAIDELVIEWWDGSYSSLKNIKPNQNITVDYKKATQAEQKNIAQGDALFDKVPTDIAHIENDYDDYKREILLPHKMSTLGPAAATSDVNKDGLGDLFIGGSSGIPGRLIHQQADGSFVVTSQNVFEQDKKYEDVGATFFDADGDGDSDLYVVSGGNEHTKGSNLYQDRLYLNDGKGQFQKSSLPQITISGSVATPLDYDQDGDLDLFVGGRQVPGFYGMPESSLLLENTDGKFEHVTSDKDVPFKDMGMVTDAIWGNFDADEENELVVAGEWMPIQIYQYGGGVFTLEKEIEHSSGWWNCLAAEDLDTDGDLDIVAGNLGLNIKFKASHEKPFKVYVNDFDENGSHDVYLAYYDVDGSQFPIRGRQCSSEQMPFISEKFGSYDEFGKATIEEILEGRMDGAIERAAETFESVVLINQGNLRFEWKALPNEAQISPIQDILVHDYNGDSILDLFVIGNYYNREVETTRSDAGIGCVLIGNGKGDFVAEHPVKSGVKSYHDARKVLQIRTASGQKIIVANNNALADFYQLRAEPIQ